MALDGDKSYLRSVGTDVKFGILGPLSVTDGPKTLNVGGPKQRTVLAVLIANAGHQVSIDSLIEAVWGDEATANARRVIQTYIATLRSEIGDVIVKTSLGWKLDVEHHSVDAGEFEDLYNTARNLIDTEPERASVALRQALAMWRGHPYADVEGHGAFGAEIARLSELRVAAQTARIDADLAIGRDADLIGEIEALMAEHPFSERFRAQHMLALYRAGRQRESIQSYSTMQTVLLEELGVDPSPELQELEMRILRQDDDLVVPPARTVQKRAVLVADPGDPIELGHLPTAQRDELLHITNRALMGAIEKAGDGVAIAAGATTYLIFESVQTAATVAESTTRQLAGNGMRLAIDWGDVVLANGGVGGAPVTRAAVMAAVANKGQVLLSADAQQAIGAAGEGIGMRFEALGSYQLHGVEDELSIYQLLVGDAPIRFPDLDTRRLPPPLPGGDSRSVPGYELRETVGVGSIGVLYRAFQPALGREVLIEVIGRSDSSDAGFVRKFEADAQRLSLIDHQNIASVIDYWREPEGAFLVYRYPRGGFLDDAKSIDANQIIQHVGSALAYAHSLDIVHGSVRPDRVILDEAGNASLIGFSIAGTEPSPSPDHPAYIASEVLEGEAPSIATDIFALGVMAQELHSGVPADAPLVSDNAAVAKALNDDPSGRQSSVIEFLGEFNPSEADTPTNRYTETRNPYKGLAAFHEGDAADFYGRAEVVEELVRALGSTAMLALVGPSGAGKSSVVRAGLIPALRSGAIPGSKDWLITDMYPDERPFRQLRKALERVAKDVGTNLTEALAMEDPTALSGIRRLLPEQSQLLVIVDQFEELFTMTGEQSRERFLEMIANATRTGDARFVITLRADFLDRPLLYPEFGEVLKQSTVMLRAPNASELADVVVEPAAGVGVELEAGLVERLVSSVVNQPGALPLLQHTLGELFEARSSDLIDLETLEEMGGIRGSLARRAESTYKSLPTAEKARTKQTFMRLVTVDEESSRTRRRVRITDLDDLATRTTIESFASDRLLVLDNDPETRTPTVELAHEALLDHWPRLSRWVDAARDDLILSRKLDEAIDEWEKNGRDASHLLTGGPLAQHRMWTENTDLTVTPRQSEYVSASIRNDESIQARRVRRRNWISAGFATAALVATVFGVAALENAQRAEEQASIADEQASIAEEQRQAAETSEELATAEAERATANEALATDSARIAGAEALAASSLAALGSDPELSVLLGIQALEFDPESSTAMGALNQAFQAHRAVFRVDAPNHLDPHFLVGSMSPDGRSLAGTDGDETRLWEVGSTDARWSWAGYPKHFFTSTYFSSDGESVIVGSTNHEGPCVRDRWTVLDASDGSILFDHTFPGLISYDLGPAQNGPYIDINRPMILAVGGEDRCGENPRESELLAVNLISGTQGVVGFGSTRSSLVGIPSLSDDGVRLATAGASGGGVFENGQEIKELPPGLSALSSDGSLVLAGNNPLELWSLDSGEKLREFKEDFKVAWFSPSGSMVYGSTVDSRALVFDVQTADLLFELRGHSGVAEIQMSEDERWLATFGGEGSARIWDIGSILQSTAGLAEFPSIIDDVYSINRTGTALATSEHLLAGRGVFPDEDSLTTETPSTIGFNEVAVYEMASGAVVATYPGALHALSADGRMVAYQKTGPAVDLTEAQTGEEEPAGQYTPFEGIVIADALTGDPIIELDGFCLWYSGPPSSGVAIETEECEEPGMWRDEVLNASFSPDGSLLATTGVSGRLVVWDLETGSILWSDQEDEVQKPRVGFEANVSFSPDGRYLATSLYRFIAILEVGSFDSIAEFETDLGGPSDMEWTPDGSRLVLNDQNLNVFVFDTTTWERVHRLVGQKGDWFPDIAVDPTGRFVATAGLDSESRIWDIETGTEVLRFSVPRTPFGLRNVVWVDEGTLVLGSRLWSTLMTTDPVELVDASIERLTRSFTVEECATYGIDPCPTLDEMKARS